MEVNMKKTLLSFLMAAVLLWIVSCEGGNSNVKAGGPAQKVSASADRMPDWVLKKKKSADYVYFVGMSTRIPDLKEAKKVSIDDATMQLVEYIGFRATTRFKSSKEMSDQDNVSTFRENVQQTIEGKGSAKVNVDVEDFYYEQYSDNTYTIYSLIKFPVDWVEKERKRLQKLVADQRQKAAALLEQSEESMKKKEFASSLDLALMALGISEKAAENSDLYDQAKTAVTEILSSLSFSVQGNPKYAYIEGGSEPLTVSVISSKTGTGAGGFMLSAVEAESNAVIASRTGNITDPDGKVRFYSEKILNDARQLSVFVSFSMLKFQDVRKTDEEFYADLQKLQKTQGVTLSLSVNNREKVIPTALAVVRILVDKNNRFQDADPVQKFQESLSGLLANRGYNIVAAEIPAKVWDNAGAERQVRAGIVNYLKENHPGIKRLDYGILTVNSLGKIGQDVKFSTYDINDSALMTVEVNFTLSMIDLATGKVDEGKKITARSYGLNQEQAAENAEKKILEQIGNETGGSGN